MAEGDMLAVMVFALLLGIGLALTRTEPRAASRRPSQGLYDVVMRLLQMVLQMAPIARRLSAVHAYRAPRIRRAGQLGAYVLVVVAGARDPPVRGLLDLGRAGSAA